MRLSFSGQQLGPGPNPWLRDADLPGKGVVMGTLLKPLHHSSLLNNNYKQALGRNRFLKVFEFRVLVSRTFVFGQPEPSTHRKQERMKENMSQTFFPPLCASRRHLKLRFSKSQTISDGIYHADVLCPLM